MVRDGSAFPHIIIDPAAQHPQHAGPQRCESRLPTQAPDNEGSGPQRCESRLPTQAPDNEGSADEDGKRRKKKDKTFEKKLRGSKLVSSSKKALS